MAFPATTSRVLFALLLVAVVTAGGAGAATVLVANNCHYTLWPAALIPAELGGGGIQLEPGQTWLVAAPAGTRGARIWARTGCSFVDGRGTCQTGDCAGELICKVPGKPPATLVEFTIGRDTNDFDYYDVSVVDGFNVGVQFSSNTAGVEGPILCRDPGCVDASHPGVAKVRTCRGNSDYQVVFCP